MKLTMAAYDELPPGERHQINAWVDQVCPDRWVFEMELLSEGRCALMTVSRDLDVAVELYAADPLHPPADILSTRVYVSSQPPECALRRMMAGASLANDGTS